MWYGLSTGHPRALTAKSKRALLVKVDSAGLATVKRLRHGIYEVNGGNWYLYRLKRDAIADGWGWAL